MSSQERSVPLFVFGVARSGTSYTHALLNAHPEIRLSYEGRLVREGPWLYRRHRRLHEREDFFALLDELCACEEEPQNAWMVDVMRTHRDQLYRRHSEQPSCARLLESVYMLPDPVRCWGNKILRVEACPQLLELWPDARVLILVRDPRAVYASQLRFFRTRIRYSALYWNLHSRWTREHAADPARYLVVRYEDFVREPLPVLRGILERVGLWQPASAARMLETHPARADGVEGWRRVLTGDQVRTIEGYCAEEMERWGYAPELGVPSRRMGAVTRGVETLLENARRVPLDPAWWLRKDLLRRFLQALRG